MLASVTPAQDRTDELPAWRRKRPQVAGIDVEGNHVFSTRDIRRLMQIRTRGFWSRLRLKDVPLLLPGAEDRDEGSIRLAYRRLGFWDAEAAISAVPDEQNQSARVTVFIEENTRYHWGETALDGDTTTLVERGQRIIRGLTRGDAADSIRLVSIITRIRSDCADRGHPQAVIGLSLNRRWDTIDVALDLRAGPLAVLGDLAIDGAKRTRESVIRREIGWEPGAQFSQKRLAAKQQDVYATGMFTFVHLEPSAVDSGKAGGPHRTDFRLRVVERKSSYIGFRTGAGQDPERDLTWDYAAEWGSRNWLGTGRQWSLSAQSGFVVITDWRVLHHRFAAKYTEPWVFGVRLPTTLTLAFEPGVRSAKQPYRVETFAGELSVTRRIQRISRWWSSLIYERVTIYGIPEDQRQSFLEELGINIRRRWQVALERDSRSNIFVPSSGARTRIDAEYVGGFLGGTHDFYKVDLSWSRYQTVSAPTVLATRFRVGWVNTHSGNSFVPTTDRFYLGGANSIRGYEENTVGPVDTSGAPTGGWVILLSNLELRTPVVSHLWFTTFADIGNNFERFRNVKPNKMLLSLGVGVQYIAPVGPIRLDYARRVGHPDYPRSDRVHLSILFSF